ncbi:tRNA-specific adenosine deaminase 1 [Entomortierella beljakovae]|nr:tRNA-specific adenosine deaminase 1 [Entomortierella beljakovae]
MPIYSSQELIQGIVAETHAQFKKLPKHGKPAVKSNGQAEWTILAGIVAVAPSKTSSTLIDQDRIDGAADTDGEHESWNIECISLATGSKCLPQGKLSPRGDLLNDCHAEILARRGFNRWCLVEMQACIHNPENSNNKFRFVGDQHMDESHDRRLFELVDPRVQFHLYVSQAPCGDATTGSLAQNQTDESRSTFLEGQKLQKSKEKVAMKETETKIDDSQGPTNAGSKHKRDSEDNMSVDIPSKQMKIEETIADLQGCDQTLGLRRGRIGYDAVGVLRTKPGRVDSEPTLSMSCSDKIARWNILGLTSALVAPFLSKPIYLESIVTRELFDALALERALNSRIVNCINSSQSVPRTPSTICPLEGSFYKPHNIKVRESPEAFEFSKKIVTEKSSQNAYPMPPVACSSSISWIASEPSVTEVIVNGCKAGSSAKQPIQLKSRSRLCKVNMFKTSIDLWESLPKSSKDRLGRLKLDRRTDDESNISIITYNEWKSLSNSYTIAKEYLFQGVLRNWVRSDKSLELFDASGINKAP